MKCDVPLPRGSISYNPLVSYSLHEVLFEWMLTIKRSPYVEKDPGSMGYA